MLEASTFVTFRIQTETLSHILTIQIVQFIYYIIGNSHLAYCQVQASSFYNAGFDGIDDVTDVVIGDVGTGGEADSYFK